MFTIAGFTADAVKFDCRFGFTDVFALGNRYYCGPSIDLSGSKALENVKGTHQSGYTNDNVEYLWVNGEHLLFVPQEIEKFFKNLLAMTFRDTNIHSISAQDLQSFPQLQSLEINHGDLSSLDGNLFMYNPRLLNVAFDDNEIEHIGLDLVTKLDHLRELALSRNTCIDESAFWRPDVLKLAPKLSVLCPPLDATITVSIPTATKAKTVNVILIE